ncbi:MAG: integrase [Actinomycetota bacterium]
MSEAMSRFATYLEQGHALTTIDGTKPEHAEEFVRAPVMTSTGARAASVATMHLRRSALRLLFRVARDIGALNTDPTVDLTLPPRSSLPVRPLSEDEVTLCRSYSLHSLRSTRRSAAWALAEATARTAELPHLRISDVDLDKERVWIHGSSKTVTRWGHLSQWGVRQLARRINALGDRSSDDRPLIYEGSGSLESRQASSCLAISQTLQAAGLSADRDLRPTSVTAWAGVRIFEETGAIDEVARRLGMRSLDRAASLIGWDWHCEQEREA